MIALLLRGFFLMGIISWYSAGVWKLIDNYFRHEYKTYLDEIYSKNKNLRPDAEVFKEKYDFPLDKEQNRLKTNHPEEQQQVEVKVCDKDFCELDDPNKKMQSSDRQSKDDDGIINYWLVRKDKDKSNNKADDDNLFCEVNCRDN
jgi:hypothetical protein